MKILISLFLIFGIIPVWAEQGDEEEIITADATSAAKEKEVISEELLKLRDPFKKPEAVSSDFKPKSELEAFSVNQYQLVGVVTGPTKLKAILQAPSGKTYFVSNGQPLGRRQGNIVKITPYRIIVVEKVVNMLGQAENVVSEIKMNVPKRVNYVSSVEVPKSEQVDNKDQKDQKE